MAELVDDLMLPITEGPSHVVCWSLLLLADKCSFLKRVQNQLDAVVGPPHGALDSIRSILEKRSRLAYSMATFWEVSIHPDIHE